MFAFSSVLSSVALAASVPLLKLHHLSTLGHAGVRAHASRSSSSKLSLPQHASRSRKRIRHNNRLGSDWRIYITSAARWPVDAIADQGRLIAIVDKAAVVTPGGSCAASRSGGACLHGVIAPRGKLGVPSRLGALHGTTVWYSSRGNLVSLKSCLLQTSDRSRNYTFEHSVPPNLFFVPGQSHCLNLTSVTFPVQESCTHRSKHLGCISFTDA